MSAKVIDLAAERRKRDMRRLGWIGQPGLGIRVAELAEGGVQIVDGHHRAYQLLLTKRAVTVRWDS